MATHCSLLTVNLNAITLIYWSKLVTETQFDLSKNRNGENAVQLLVLDSWFTNVYDDCWADSKSISWSAAASGQTTLGLSHALLVLMCARGLTIKRLRRVSAGGRSLHTYSRRSAWRHCVTRYAWSLVIAAHRYTGKTVKYQMSLISLMWKVYSRAPRPQTTKWYTLISHWKRQRRNVANSWFTLVKTRRPAAGWPSKLVSLWRLLSIRSSSEFEFIGKCTSSQMSISVNKKYKIHWDNGIPICLEALTCGPIQKAVRYF